MMNAILLSSDCMYHDAVYHMMLSILEEHYKKDPLFYVPSSELRSRLEMPIEELRPYARDMEMEGYASKLEGLAPTFIVKFTSLGHDAYIHHRI